jgi:hypothetical protein
MAVLQLVPCIVCRQPIVPGTEAKNNLARHDACTGAGPIDEYPTVPEKLKQMFPNSQLDAFTIQRVTALIEERDFWETKCKSNEVIIATLRVNQSEFDRINGQFKRLALFFRQEFSTEIEDPVYARMDGVDMAIHYLMYYRDEVRKFRASPKVSEPETHKSLFEHIFGRW